MMRTIESKRSILKKIYQELRNQVNGRLEKRFNQNLLESKYMIEKMCNEVDNYNSYEVLLQFKKLESQGIVS